MGECPTVDLVILNYNSGDTLSESFATLRETEYPRVHIIVVDNGSSDGSDEFIREYLDSMKNLTFIKNKKNLGCPGGLNSAMPYLQGKYSVFLNEDIFVIDKGWLKKLTNILERNANIGAIGPALVDRGGNCHCSSTYFSKLYVLASGSQDEELYSDLADVPFVGLGMMITRTDLYKKIGGFRERYFLYWDDVDYCIRVWIMGYRVCVTNSTFLQHLHQVSIGRNVTGFMVRYLTERNSLMFLFIFYPRSYLMRYLPAVLIKRVAMIANHLRKRRSLDALGMFLGSCASLYHLPWIIKERRAVPSKYRIGEVIEKISSLTPDPYKDRKLTRLIVSTFGLR